MNAKTSLPVHAMNHPFGNQFPRTLDGASPDEKPLIPSELFGNDKPLEIEIGCGKGKFLVGRSQSFPEMNFLGIDRVGKWMKIGIKRGEKRNLGNLKFLKADVREILVRLPLECVTLFHIYFPDPWPKRRHRKRRLVNAELLNLLKTRLIPGGIIHIATDDRDYFQQISAEASRMEWKFMRESTNERLLQPELMTNYELKFQAAGRDLFYLLLQKPEHGGNK